jgi:hypothetical protein
MTCTIPAFCAIMGARMAHVMKNWSKAETNGVCGQIYPGPIPAQTRNNQPDPLRELRVLRGDPAPLLSQTDVSLVNTSRPRCRTICKYFKVNILQPKPGASRSRSVKVSQTESNQFSDLSQSAIAPLGGAVAEAFGIQPFPPQSLASYWCGDD